MIKLIATDLDGTLLDDEKRIHPSFWEVHKTLTQKGVLFIAASGRQYYRLKEQFAQIENEIIFLAENGSFVLYKDEEILLNDMPIEHARRLIKKGREVPDVDIILCGKSSAYIESSYGPFVEDASRYYGRLKKVDDLTHIEDAILKVTLWDHANAEYNAYPYFQEEAHNFKVAVAGDVWLDISHLNAGKGNAIKHVQKRFGISQQETLVFGDYLNDLDMMGVGYYSYAMKNAHSKIIDISRFVTRYDNNHNGVVETIKELTGL